MSFWTCSLLIPNVIVAFASWSKSIINTLLFSNAKETPKLTVVVVLTVSLFTISVVHKNISLRYKKKMMEKK